MQSQHAVLLQLSCRRWQQPAGFVLAMSCKSLQLLQMLRGKETSDAESFTLVSVGLCHHQRAGSCSWSMQRWPKHEKDAVPLLAKQASDPERLFTMGSACGHGSATGTSHGHRAPQLMMLSNDSWAALCTQMGGWSARNSGLEGGIR